LNHISIGVYASGSHVVNIVRPEDLKGHIDYNKVMRFGRALFIDGQCFNEGYLNKDEVEKWKETIATMKTDSSVSSKVYR
jgi:hypothetical protein